MSRLLPVLLALCAAASVSSVHVGKVPQYKVLLEKYEEAVQVLKRLSPDPTVLDVMVTDVRYHYGLLVATLRDVVHVVSLLCSPSYDQYYKTGVVKGVGLALEDSASVGVQVQKDLDAVEAVVEDVVSLVRKVCFVENVPNCDVVVAEEVEKNPLAYGWSNEVFLKVSKVVELYLKNTYEVAAKNHNVLSVVVNGKDVLRDLVLKLVDVFRAVHVNVMKC